MDDRTRLQRYFLHLLGRREYGRAELRRKAEEKDYATELIEAVLAQLAADNYQSDTRFLESFIRHQSQRGQGPLKIRQLLRQKGLEEASINTALAELDWQEIAEQLYQRKYNGQPIQSPQERAKRQRFLLQRGFNFSHFHNLL